MKTYGSYVHVEKGHSPLIIAVPHTGSLTNEVFAQLPDFMKKVVDLNDPDVRKTINGRADVAVPYITGFHERTRDTRIYTDMPAGLVDANRTESQVDGLSVENRGKPAHASGLIWRTIPPVISFPLDLFKKRKPMLKRPYTEAEYQQLLDLAYRPFSQAVRDATAETVERYKHAIIIAPHSFPSRIGLMIPFGRDKGSYLIGPPAQRSARKPSGTREFLIDMLIHRRMPDVIKITHPDICASAIHRIVDEEFSEKGYVVSEGHGPFAVRPGDIEYTQGNVQNNVHYIALEQVAHNNLEPNRHLGSLEVDMRVAEIFRPIYQAIFDRAAALTTEELRAA